jgi:hypothetical protein
MNTTGCLTLSQLNSTGSSSASNSLLTGKAYAYAWEEHMTSARRIVQIYVVDPDEAVPVDRALLYQDGPRLTDATDDELRYGLNLPALLEKHNAYRVESGLEPARIRDIKIEIATIAKF